MHIPDQLFFPFFSFPKNAVNKFSTRVVTFLPAFMKSLQLETWKIIGKQFSDSGILIPDTD